MESMQSRFAQCSGMVHDSSLTCYNAFALSRHSRRIIKVRLFNTRTPYSTLLLKTHVLEGGPATPAEPHSAIRFLADHCAGQQHPKGSTCFSTCCRAGRIGISGEGPHIWLPLHPVEQRGRSGSMRTSIRMASCPLPESGHKHPCRARF